MPIKRALKGIGKVSEKGGQLWATVPREKLLRALTILKHDFNAWRINTITGYDDGRDIWLIYHITVSEKLVNIKTKLSRDRPVIETISFQFPSARLYERDIHEMLGITVTGMEDTRRLFLPEGYKGKPPLLRTEAPGPPSSTSAPPKSQKPAKTRRKPSKQPRA